MIPQKKNKSNKDEFTTRSARLFQMNFKMPTMVMKLYKMRVITTPTIQKGGWIPSFKIYCKYTLFYDSKQHQTPKFVAGEPHCDIIPTF
mgnify:CR=1 FL=1